MEKKMDEFYNTRGRGFSRGLPPRSLQFPEPPRRPVCENFPELLRQERAASYGRGLPQASEALRRPGQFRRVAEVDLPSRANERHHTLQQQVNHLYVQEKDCDLSSAISAAKALCETPRDLQAVCDIIYDFSVKNKPCSRNGALLFSAIGDLEVDDTKMKILLMRSLQRDFERKRDVYKHNKKQFWVNAFFLSEVLHKVRLSNGDCYSVLISPALDYFTMLVGCNEVDGIKVFIEQIEKVYKDLLDHNKQGFDELLNEMRKHIISDSTSSTCRLLLLRTLEQIQMRFERFDPKVEAFYSNYND